MAKNDGSTPADSGATAELREGEHNPFVHGLLTQAATLREEKEALFKRVGANREALRNAANTGFVSDEQRKAIEEWYPTPVRGGKDKVTPAS